MDEYDDFGMSSREIRFQLISMLIEKKPSSTKVSTITNIAEKYYEWIIARDGNVVDFVFNEAKK